MIPKPHICHLTSAHPQNDVRIFHKECKSLSKQFQVSLIVINGDSEMLDGINIIGINCEFNSRKERFTKAVNKVLKAALELDADVYHLHDPELLRIASKLKKKGKKVIYDAHEDLPRQILAKHYIPKHLRKGIASVVESYENKVVKKVDGIITATPTINERFIKLNKDSCNINNFPILDELINIPIEKKEGLSICYVGGITKIRGIKEIIKSIENIDCSVLLAGSFLETGLKEEVAEYPGWNKVNELGYLSRKGVIDVYKKSKLGLVTLHPTINYLDSLPVKMFEYMAAGIPIIASNFPLWKSIIEENNCGICVNPENPEEISSAIEVILQNEDKALEMGENGRKLIIEKYNWSIEEDKLISFYKNLIG